MTHFVLIVPHALLEYQKLVTNAVKDEFAWWHWSPDVWLLTSQNDGLDALTLRQKFAYVFPPQIQFAILRVDIPSTGSNWYASGPAEWATWFREMWEPKFPR